MTRLPDGREAPTIADLAAEVIRHAETEAGDPFAVAQSGIALARAVLAGPTDPHLADARRFEGYLRAFSLGSEARHAGTVHDRPPTEMDELTEGWWKQGREYTRRGLELDAAQEEGRQLRELNARLTVERYAWAADAWEAAATLAASGFPSEQLAITGRANAAELRKKAP